MADLNCNEEEPHLLPPKRKQISQDLEDESTKKLRPDDEPPAAVEQKPIAENGDKDEIEDNEEEDEEEEDYEGEEEVDSDDEDDEDEAEHSNGGTGSAIDRKGKGIMKDEKGKGKMIEPSDDDDDDDSDESGDVSEFESDDDFSDDPLTEVDLDNILPSRTRRRAATGGVRIAGDEVNNDKDNDA